MSADDAASFVAEALPAFISEAREQIEAYEQQLLELERRPHDRELLDALFRCAHTVKGSAGIFGLDAVVGFTHHVETLLDALRDGRLALTPEISTLLLQCNDQIRALIDAAQGRAESYDAEARRAALVARLQALGSSAAVAPGAVPVHATRGAARRWHVSVRFGVDTFRNGLDPLVVLHYLRGLGTIGAIACDVDAVPPLESIDPESSHLGFEFGLETEASRDEIESAFSFVRDDCTLHLLAPGSTAADFVRLIESMPDNPRLGDILIAAGAITRAQLQDALRAQASDGASGAAPQPIGEILQAKSGVSPQVVAAALQKQQRGGGGHDDQRFVRVQADRLDAVINLLGELMIASDGVAMLARQTRQNALLEANQQVGRLIEEIRNSTLQLRMVPIGETFSRFRRVVRDTAAEMGKEVALEFEGGDTELDKSVVERIADPLMHLVRNSLDHGLETPEERIAAGKPGQGRLQLTACHEFGHILIRIVDDGRGIVRQKVLERAWQRGLVERGVRPSDAQILQLIFQPGFSTAETVTSLSGRGVGMDVVRRNIEAVRGNVGVHSVEGHGCTIEIRLPLTLAIIDGFLVSVGASKFVFPLNAVVEVIETRGGDAVTDALGRSIVELRGKALPIVSLRTLYGIESPPPDRVSAIVIQAGEQRYGVLVDQLLGQQQTVIKPMGRLFRSLRGISGSSILGNGDVALIFDVGALGEFAAATPPPRRAAEPVALT